MSTAARTSWGPLMTCASGAQPGAMSRSNRSVLGACNHLCVCMCLALPYMIAAGRARPLSGTSVKGQGSALKASVLGACNKLCPRHVLGRAFPDCCRACRVTWHLSWRQASGLKQLVLATPAAAAPPEGPAPAAQDMKSSFQYRPGPHDTQVHLQLPPPSPDLVALYTFDEGQGYTVHDASANGHDLILAEEPEWMVRLPAKQGFDSVRVYCPA